MIGTLESHSPDGPLPEKWRKHQNNSRLVAPNNRRKFEIVVVGTGLERAGIDDDHAAIT